ncbi:MAG: PHP domain-containing protein [Clostridium sp.]|uniref:PHP domain-containing protein n=1 Tax=Clostridium sp. TaxID=1506 RepID=UPI003F3E8C96
MTISLKDLEQKKWFNIHTHQEDSNNRLLDCTNRIPQLVDYSKGHCNLLGFAVTDHDSLSGHINAIQINKQLKKDGDEEFKIALGNEIYLVNSLEEVRDNYVGGGVTKFPHFILVAKDEIGHEAIRELSTRAWSTSFTKVMRRVCTTKQHLAEICLNPKYKGHLISSSACLGNEIAIEFRKHLEGDREAMSRLDKFVQACKYIFEEDYYLELQPSFNEEQIEYNKFLLEYGKSKGIKCIVSTDAHYLNKSYEALHSAFLNSKDGERELGDFYSSTYLMSPLELWDYFKDYLTIEQLSEMLDNTVEIYNKIKFFDLSHPTNVPSVTIPPFSIDNCLLKQYGSSYKYINKFINSNDLIDRYLIFKLNEGMGIYKQTYGIDEMERINYELEHMWEISEELKSRLSGYYLLTQEIMELAWTISLCGIGRGSTAGFYCSYLLGIAQMNPMLHKDLKPWRHIHKEKISYADVDSDYEPDKKPLIIEKLKEKYGEERVLVISTAKTLSSKSSILTVARGLGINNDIASGITSLIPYERGKNWCVSDCLYGNEEKDRKPVQGFKKYLEEYPLLFQYAMQLEGLKTNISSHASGVYIYDDSFVRERNSLMKTPSGESVTAYTMEDSDYVGGLKIDFLVIDALSKIRSCMDLLLEDGKIEWQGTLKDTYNKYLHPDNITLEGDKLFKPIYDGTVTNAFQYETPLGQSVLKKIKPNNLYELSNANAVMRLASKSTEQPLDKYVRYRQDINEWYKDMNKYGLNSDEISILESYLLDRYGICEVQEVLMEMCMSDKISNFTFGEADGIRKGLSKGKPKLIEKGKELFYSKGQTNGCRKVFLDYIWEEQFSMSFG